MKAVIFLLLQKYDIIMRVASNLYRLTGMDGYLIKLSGSDRPPNPPWPLLISDVGLELEGTLINCYLL